MFLYLAALNRMRSGSGRVLLAKQKYHPSFHNATTTTSLIVTIQSLYISSFQFKYF
jgi:hypothetical protein